MDAPAQLTCTDSDRARETSESTRRMEFSERLALTVVPQHFFAARLICLQTSSRVIIPATIALGGGLQTGGWESAVARSCGQIEMLLVQLSMVKVGCKEIRIDRLRQPAAHASRHLRLVQQRLLYFSRSPCALCLLLCGTSAGAGALPSCCFPRLCSLLCSLHCVLPPHFC